MPWHEGARFQFILIEIVALLIASALIATFLIYLPILLALPLPVFAGLGWSYRWWKLPTRIHYTLVTLAVLSGVWWTNYWNLLGFQM